MNGVGVNGAGVNGGGVNNAGMNGGVNGCADPCVYVYELPARMYVLSLKAEPEWAFYEHGPADYRSFIAMHVALLKSEHRTADPR